MPPQPQSIEEINIPDALHFTLSGDLFLVKDCTFDQNKLLLFTTRSNVFRLSQAQFWMMDGTFKTVPTIF